MHRVLVANGPNLNLLGSRRPEVYGATSFSDLERLCRQWGHELGIEIDTFQSNHEGALIDRLHQAKKDGCEGVVFNPGAYSHTSFALHDAIEAIEIPTVEVHISNVKEREEWRRSSRVGPACVYSIYGRGVDGYRFALRHLHYRSMVPLRTASYGPGDDNLADVRLPTGPAAGVWLLIHGGLWLHMWTRDLMDGLAVDLCKRGVATVNIEYRRTGLGGGWPQTMHDVEAAAGWVRTEWSGLPLTLLGHSAGAQLAVMAAAAAKPERLVLLSGVLDLVATLQSGTGAGPTAAFLGGSDPEEASPLAHLPISVPQVVVHGTDDDLVSVAQSRMYTERIVEEGGQVDYLELPGEDHFSILDPTSAAWQSAVKRVMASLEITG